MTPAQLIERVLASLGQETDWEPAQLQLEALVPDGSRRRFFRVQDGTHSMLAVLPPENDAPGMDEARAFHALGTHLEQCGAPTPQIFAFDQASGLALCEDLGQERLYERVQAQGIKASLPFYEQAVQQLAQMQVRAAQGFQASWCWDTPVYDQELMLARESGYFLQACCTDLLGIAFDRVELEASCRQLARDAAQAPTGYFLHRDFQSRNIMICNEQVRFIDFQGGRLGPLGYDLASLLIDPYIQLPQEAQEHLLGVYLNALAAVSEYDPAQFRHEYVLLALQRNLQILGAFAFLSKVRKKRFFAQFLSPALNSLRGLLAKPEAAEYAALKDICEQCRQKLNDLNLAER
nr:phosphotransferase [uncultured Desulfobulbus sp.]